jgi:hypothetical protein
MFCSNLNNTIQPDNTGRSIFYYVSGHGFGHATRSLEVIKVLHSRRPEIPVYIRSWASASIFNQRIVNVYLTYVKLDIGVVQEDGISINISETLKQLKQLGDRASKLITTEKKALKSHQAGCIVSDIPALAHRLAHDVHIPSLAITNFSWDWIYDDWTRDYPDAQYASDFMRSNYKLCDRLLLLPYSETLPAFKNVQKTPILGRRAALDRVTVKSKLGLRNEDRPIVLLSFGGMGLKRGQLPLLKHCRDFRFISTFPIENTLVTQLKPLELYGISYPDLVGFADVVVTKPGYGIVTECAINHTRMLYTDRGSFREYQAILKELPYWNCSAYILRDRLSKGLWKNKLEELMNQDPTQVPGALEARKAEGADVAADAILNYYDLGRTAN